MEHKDRQMKAINEANNGAILYPTPDDVLIGRGTPYQDHVGNVRLSRLIEILLDKYRACASDNFAKTCLSMHVIKTVQDYGGRFVQQTSQGWSVADDSVARQKVSSAFRFRIGKVADVIQVGTSGSRMA
jgi:hypothetical protein